MTFFTLFSYVMDGFAFAGEALAGKYYGANDDALLRKVWRHLFLWGGGITILFTAVYAMGGVGFLSLLTDSGNVVEASLPYFFWALLIPVAGVAAFIYDGIFIGITETRGMLIACLIASVVFFTLYYLLSPFMANHALWLSLIVFLALRGIVQHLLFRRIRIKG
jgi:MATE family multidrug resistance protein